MNTAAQTDYAAAPQGWFSRSAAWLDEHGKGAWIASMIVSFIMFWPVGLAFLIYMIATDRLFSKSHRRLSQAHHERRQACYAKRHGFSTSGNRAFDAYKAETLRRLTSEQEAFETFLERLRAAKDKSEFDQFMDERADQAQAERDEAYEDEIDQTQHAAFSDVEILDERFELGGHARKLGGGGLEASMA